MKPAIKSQPSTPFQYLVEDKMPERLSLAQSVFPKCRMSAPCLLLLPRGFWVPAILGRGVCSFTTVHAHPFPMITLSPHQMTCCPSKGDTEVLCLQDSQTLTVWPLKQHRSSPGMQTNAPITLELPLTLVCVQGSDSQDNGRMLYLSSTFWSRFTVE